MNKSSNNLHIGEPDLSLEFLADVVALFLSDLECVLDLLKLLVERDPLLLVDHLRLDFLLLTELCLLLQTGHLQASQYVLSSFILINLQDIIQVLYWSVKLLCATTLLSYITKDIMFYSGFFFFMTSK